MLLRFSLVIALTIAPLLANQDKPVGNCCGLDADSMSSQKFKALLEKTEPILAPCCGNTLHIKGTMVLSIAVDTDGEVTCVAYVSGHPLIIGVAIDSVRHWKFRPHVVKGLKKKFCGRIALRFEANEYAVRYEVI
jgi:outer membrane biosynthesis protein TonB